MNGTVRCHHCEDVIGVYEPMIALTDGQARNTSRAAEQDDREPAGECYHSACFTRVHGEHEVLGLNRSGKPAPFPRSIADGAPRHEWETQRKDGLSQHSC